MGNSGPFTEAELDSKPKPIQQLILVSPESLESVAYEEELS